MTVLDVNSLLSVEQQVSRCRCVGLYEIKCLFENSSSKDGPFRLNYVVSDSPDLANL